MNQRYRPDCTRIAHVLWALKQIALFVVPCAILVASGVALAKHIAPTSVTIHAPDEE